MKLELNNIEVTMKPDEPYINSILWEFEPDEEPVTLDREFTDWTYVKENNKLFLNMTWKNVYIWNRNTGEQEPVPAKYDDNGYVKGHLLGIEVEDDAPEGYGIISF